MRPFVTLLASTALALSASAFAGNAGDSHSDPANAAASAPNAKHHSSKKSTTGKTDVRKKGADTDAGGTTDGGAGK
ncbi:hypothetical protein GCM10007860_04940 [Chitiniphilus shinanonensis]|uniref:Uncharacterized protein n=1 Tax=Chitiniphilus shinanonensis TaxID=553088 RepID=A0ABQ6BN96_9NEIS|nr:hypothetical protein [Chitiniphilus shinanonensis]GLS03351.1 hypothetical protein GCM10007860_04940 [Chitiniphilus shinanonensis]